MTITSTPMTLNCPKVHHPISSLSCSQTCIDEVLLWMNSNKLQLNTNKTEVMPVDSASRLESVASEHFTERDFVNFMAQYQMGFASEQNLQGCPQDNRIGQNSSSNLQG